MDTTTRICPSCRAPIARSRGSAYCPQCGRTLVDLEPLAHRCTGCGRVLEVDYRYCDGCGQSRYGEPGPGDRVGLAAYARSGAPRWARVPLLALLLPFWVTSEIRQTPTNAWVKGGGVATVWVLILGIAVTASGSSDRQEAVVPTPSPQEVRAAPAPGPTSRPEPPSDAVPGPPDHAMLMTVTRVIDGDSVVISGLQLGREDGQASGRQARLVGVDTPEFYEGPECYGREAADFTLETLEGRDVLVAFDVERIDPHDRALVYIWELNRTFFNARLVAEGFARHLTIPPNVRYAEAFERLEAEAREAGVGMWGDCPDAAPAAEVQCHLSYPDGCVPPPPPELDCDDIAHSDFTVRWDIEDPDPHGLDPEGNGIGCES